MGVSGWTETGASWGMPLAKERLSYGSPGRKAVALVVAQALALTLQWRTEARFLVSFFLACAGPSEVRTNPSLHSVDGQTFICITGTMDDKKDHPVAVEAKLRKKRCCPRGIAQGLQKHQRRGV